MHALPGNLPSQPVSGPGAWTGAALRERADWIHQLDRACLAEIDLAVRRLRERAATLAQVTRADLGFRRFAEFLDSFLHEDLAGRGIGVIRGLPSERYSEAELEMLFWGIGQYLGVGVSQNADGDRLGHVRSLGLDYDALNVRGYQTAHALEFHCDPSDAVGLLCVRQAAHGGDSFAVSGLSVYNTVLAEHPEYLARLQAGFVYDRRGEEAFYQAPVSEPVPVFAQVEGELSMRYVRKSIETGMAKLGRSFSDHERTILDYLDAVTRRPELTLSMRLEPGDMQFLNNYTVLHARSAYTDHAAVEKRRHLLRLWLKVPGFRKLDEAFVEYDAASGWSRREGIRPPLAPRPRDELTPLLACAR